MPGSETVRARAFWNIGSSAAEFEESASLLEPDSEPPWVADQPGIAFDTALLGSALGLARRPFAVRESVALGSRLVRRPSRLIGPLGRLVGDAAQIVGGRNEHPLMKTDRRYEDAAWTGNPLFRMLAEGHAAVGRAVEALLDGAELDPAADYRLRLVVTNIVAALAPANFPWSNPAAIKAMVDTGGASLAIGARRAAKDLRGPPHLPARSEPTHFVLGGEIAATPGAIVLRTPVLELIQYKSVTGTVHREPLLAVPSLVNKYYLTDLSPGRSLSEHAVRSGAETFHISWINPDAQQRHFNLDTYVSAITDALAAIRSITGAPRVHTLGVCAGGQLLAITAAHLAALGRLDELASLTLTVAVVDHADAVNPAGLLSPRAAEIALRRIDRAGVVDGRQLQTWMALLRPVDSIWWAWVQRYLLAADIPRLDLFHWSEDPANMPAALARDLLELMFENKLTHPGTLTVLGTPIDLRTITVPSYLIAGATDNLTPWRSCFRTAALLGGRTRFVLVRGGHLQAILRPPSSRSGGFLTASTTPRDPDRWLAQATDREGSWWDDWLRWIARRSDGSRPAPPTLGGVIHPSLEPAPGAYVRERHE